MDEVKESVTVKDALTQAAEEKILSFDSTDSGNAELFRHLFGEDFHFLQEDNDWLSFDGFRWRRDWLESTGTQRLASDEAMHKLIGAIELKYNLYVKHHNLTSIKLKDMSKDDRDHLIKINQCKNLRKLTPALQLASSLPGMKFLLKQFDTDCYLLGCKNTIIDLQTGKPVEPSKLSGRLVLKSNNVIYDPSAKCPRWLQFMEEVFEGDQETISFIKRLAGYTLTGLVCEEYIFILLGETGTGKSTLLCLLSLLLGEYYYSLPAYVYYIQKWDQNSRHLFNLCGKRLATTMELQPHRQIDNNFIKQLTGGDKATGASMRQMPLTYSPTVKLFWGMNDMVALDTLDTGIVRRLCVIPFNVGFGGTSKEDKRLKDKILPGELPGILNWAIEGVVEYQQTDSLMMSPKVKKKTKEMIELCNPVASFIKERVVRPALSDVEFKNMWGAFGMFRAQEGIPPTMKENSFSREMARLGYGSDTSTGQSVFKGMSLKP